MKYTSLLSICSVLTLTTISFGQDTVMTGMGGNSSGFGGVDLDVPEEEQQNDCPPNDNDDNEVVPNDDHQNEGGQDEPVGSSDDDEPEETPIENDEKDVPSQADSVDVVDKSWLNWVQPKYSWIYTVKTYEKEKCTPIDTWTAPKRKRFVLRGNCPNGTSTSQRPDDNPNYDDDITYPGSYACDCCCHLNRDGSIDLTENSDDWDDNYGDSSSNNDSGGSGGKYGNQSDDRYSSNGKDDQNGYEDVPCSSGDDDRRSTRKGKRHDRKKRGGSCDNNNGQDRSQDDWSDDCECSCNCKRFGELAFYD